MNIILHNYVHLGQQMQYVLQIHKVLKFWNQCTFDDRISIQVHHPAIYLYVYCISYLLPSKIFLFRPY